MPATSRYATPTSLHEIDIRALKRDGLLVPGARVTVTKSFAGRVIRTAVVTMQTDADEVLIAADGRVVFVELVHTAQHLGGERVWFSCPSCGRRAAILYPFACRTCCGITYPSQREAPHHRAIRRAQHHRARLGGSGNLTEELPARPWGMWDRTYRRRLEACRKADARTLAGMSAVIQRWRETWGRSA